ncbi:acyl-CoA thioesterase II [Phenylobacterium sp.]|jgi:acyl-CoA thioesterase-2|uniref:acyl-CoA thioesterase n=1 Tax=Phenylobacterium sp. TaxID=1871053 RepID=UPI002F42E4EA
MDPVARLIASLALERIELNLFRGTTPARSGDRIFGGQVIAQALLAAYETVDSRICHSLHCYFIRPGDPKIPILFEVDRARDGGSFTTRRVAAIQNGRQIFNFAASFQDAETGFEHQSQMPPVPAPESLPPPEASFRPPNGPSAASLLRRAMRLDAIETRPAPPPPAGPGGTPTVEVWMRARGAIGPDPRQQQAVMAFTSDMGLMGTAFLPHPLTWETPGLQSASLDHAMWFHRPSDFSVWHLFAHDSPSASGGRGFNRGSIFRADGTLVASVAQEGLMRMRPPKT